MPRTPRAWRPIGRTSFSSNRTALPASENSITSWRPSVIAAPIRKSPGSRSTAIRPALRGLANSGSGVFFTVPLVVAMNTKCSPSNARTGSTTVIFSPSASGNMFTIGLPRDAREPCGASHTFNQ